MIFTRKFCFILSLCTLLSVTACTSVKFNKRYEGAKWEQVYIAPSNDEYNKEIVNILVHELGTQDFVRIVQPEITRNHLSEHNLLEEFNSGNELAALNKLASKTGVKGFLTIDIAFSRPSFGESYYHQAKLNTKLYDAVTLDIVGSTLKEDSTVFFSEEHLIRMVAEDTVIDLKEILYKLNSSN